MKITNDKIKVNYIRKKSTKITHVTFQVGEHGVKKVDRYKYLGDYLDEFLNYQTIRNILPGAASRSLGSVISKFKSFRNFGFKTYSKLFHSGVVPILDYCSGVQRFQKGIPAIRCCGCTLKDTHLSSRKRHWLIKY